MTATLPTWPAVGQPRSLTVGSVSCVSEPEVGGRRVTWAELFFDLVFVFAVTEVSSLVESDHSAPGLLRALVVFVPIYWVWVGTTIQANLRDPGKPALRLGMFAVALAGLFMALAVPDAYRDRALLFAGSYWAARLVLGLPSLRRARRELNPYVVSMVLTGPLLVVGALQDPAVRQWVWAASALLDLSTPTLLRARLKGVHYDAPHLAERFGLFVLIAIGESVVAVGASAHATGPLQAGTALAVAAAFALSCGLWWVYFHFAADAVRHALATAKVQLDITRLVLSYGHLALIASVIGVAVGMREAVAHPGGHLGWAVAGLLYGGTALYLATFGYTRWTMFHLVSITRLTSAAAVVLLLPLAPLLPALASLLALAVVVTTLNLVEYLRAARTR